MNWLLRSSPCIGGCVLRLLGELLEELRQRLPQLLHQLLDLLVGGALLERLLQALLGGAQGALGVGQVAVLDAQGNVPQLGDDAVARRRACRRAAGANRPSAAQGTPAGPR